MAKGRDPSVRGRVPALLAVSRFGARDRAWPRQARGPRDRSRYSDAAGSITESGPG
jgi:hypothetical protein